MAETTTIILVNIGERCPSVADLEKIADACNALDWYHILVPVEKFGDPDTAGKLASDIATLCQGDMIGSEGD
jgi:hypothetical protein